MFGAMMSIRGDDIDTGILRRWVAHLLLIAFIVRALVPAGYMPDFSAAAKGVFKVVVCSAMGAKSISFDADGKPVPNQQADHPDQPCAFTGMASLALPSSDATPVVMRALQRSISIPHLAVQLPPSRAGPPLGSRGPPQIS